jgi:hypothetical protein
VSQKGPEKKVNKCGKLRLTAWVDFKEICFVIFIWNYHYSTQPLQQVKVSIEIVFGSQLTRKNDNVINIS